MGKTISKIVGNVLFAILLILILLVVFTALPSASSRKGTYTLGAYSMFNVLTPSMVPEFYPGSLIFVQKVPESELNVGDVITYYPIEENTTILTHRIVSIEQDEIGDKRYVTRGDANNIEDRNPITYKEIIGKKVFHLSHVGSILTALRTPVGIGAVVAIAAAFLILSNLLEKKRKRQEHEKVRKSNLAKLSKASRRQTPEPLQDDHPIGYLDLEEGEEDYPKPPANSRRKLTLEPADYSRKPSAASTASKGKKFEKSLSSASKNASSLKREQKNANSQSSANEAVSRLASRQRRHAEKEPGAEVVGGSSAIPAIQYPTGPIPVLQYDADSLPADQPQYNTRPIPVVQPQYNTAPIPAVQPQYNTGPIPAVQPQYNTGPIPAVQPQYNTGPVPAVQPQYNTGPIPNKRPASEETKIYSWPDVSAENSSQKSANPQAISFARQSESSEDALTKIVPIPAFFPSFNSQEGSFAKEGGEK
ncbi:MAG: signal peptidase I [Clostridiales bacterium]|jgi:signal peptidase|nr:signal peptidase I [Clostridiales bacterium]